MPAHRKDYDKAVRLYNTGFSVQKVANYFKVTRQTMHEILKRRNVVFRPNKRYGKDNHFFRGGSRASDRCQNILEYAIQKGEITRKTYCVACWSDASPVCKDGRSAIQAHHHDYNKPYDVMWLCPKCHYEWHRHFKPIEFKGDF